MIADFIAALPEITMNISNSVASAAASYGQRPAASGDRKFFRVAADWSMDSDGDGRYDWQEIIFDGNNPYAADSDGDGNPDVAQDNSGPAPTLDGGPPYAGETGPVMAAASVTSAPPRAIIEAKYAWGSREQYYFPNDPERESIIILHGEPYNQIEPLRNKATYAEFSQGVDDLLLNQNDWETSNIDHYESSNWKSEPAIDSDPKINGMYRTGFNITRRAFRLKLDAPAPEGGYRIPLRIISYGSPADSSGYGPFFGIKYEDLILTVDEGETVGKPAMLSTPLVSENQRITSSPVGVGVYHYNLDDNPDFIPRNFSQGACILLGEAVGCTNPYLYYFPVIGLTTEWQTRQLLPDGTLGAWNTTIAPHRPNTGIHQLQAVINFPDGTKIPVPYLRMAHAKGRFNGKTPREPNLHLEAGQPDYIGVCGNQLSLDLRDEAIRWIGRTEYAKAASVSVEPFNPFNPSTKDRDKCSLFLTHLANRVGAETPYFYRKSKKNWITNIWDLIPAAPVARDDWHLEPELNIDLDDPGWQYRGAEVLPAPGMSAASYGNPPNSGHCGILDYDGSWISAGKLDVNKAIHLSDADPHYRPTHFRRR